MAKKIGAEIIKHRPNCIAQKGEAETGYVSGLCASLYGRNVQGGGMNCGTTREAQETRSRRVSEISECLLRIGCCRAGRKEPPSRPEIFDTRHISDLCMSAQGRSGTSDHFSGLYFRAHADDTA